MTKTNTAGLDDVDFRKSGFLQILKTQNYGEYPIARGNFYLYGCT